MLSCSWCQLPTWENYRLWRGELSFPFPDLPGRGQWAGNMPLPQSQDPPPCRWTPSLGSDFPPGKQRLSLWVPLKVLLLQRFPQLLVERSRWLHVALPLHEGSSGPREGPSFGFCSGSPDPRPFAFAASLAHSALLGLPALALPFAV